MQHSSQRIDAFVAAARRRVNRGLLLHALLWCGLIAAAALLVVALLYIARGYAVPVGWYAAAVAGWLFATLLVWQARCRGQHAAAAMIDRQFALKDAVSSSLSFQAEHRAGGLYDLQRRQTEAAIARLSLRDVRQRIPRWLVALTPAMLVAAALLALVPDSAAVVAERQFAQQTEARTDEINQYLEELIDELERQAEDEDEQKLLEANKLRQWVEELKSTTDPKEALRQYAKLERKLASAAQRLAQKRDEQLLAAAASELAKAPETRPLAKKLEHKQYKPASKDIDALKTDPKLKLTEQQKELARLKAAAQRLAQAARDAKRSDKQHDKQNAAGQPSRPSNRSDQSSDQAASSDQLAQQHEGELDDTLLELDENVQKLDEALEKALRELEQLDELSDEKLGECEACRLAANESLDKLSKFLRGLQTKRDTQKKLAALRNKLGQCQSYLRSNGKNQPQSLAQMMSQQRGGKKAGEGTDRSINTRIDPLEDNGNTTLLTGQKRQGPSLTAVEDADSGTGVSRLRDRARRKAFQRQLEAFVAREDVPDDVKAGVKAYFENIHQAGEGND